MSRGLLPLPKNSTPALDPSGLDPAVLAFFSFPTMACLGNSFTRGAYTKAWNALNQLWPYSCFFSKLYALTTFAVGYCKRGISNAPSLRAYRPHSFRVTSRSFLIPEKCRTWRIVMHLIIIIIAFIEIMLTDAVRYNDTHAHQTKCHAGQHYIIEHKGSIQTNITV